MKNGDKVVCVDFHNNETYGEPPRLARGVVYVVSEVGKWEDKDFVNLIGVRPPYKTVGWKMRRFRTLEELKLQSCNSKSSENPKLQTA